MAHRCYSGGEMLEVLKLAKQQKGRLFMAALLSMDDGEVILDEAIRRLCQYDSFSQELSRLYQREQNAAVSFRLWPDTAAEKRA